MSKVILLALASVLLAVAAAQVIPSPPVWPSFWAAKVSVSASSGSPSDLTMYCDAKNGRSRADYVAGTTPISMIWDYSSGYFYQLQNGTCQRAKLRQPTMNALPVFKNFTYGGPDNVYGTPVEKWYGAWTVNPSPYNNMISYYYVNQVIATPKLVFFNPFPQGRNMRFLVDSYTTSYDAWATYVSPTVGCREVKEISGGVEQLLPRGTATITVDACNFVA
eukprot:TRINITY_DN447_c0_g1_i1.p1 TRINITY_DN447_c0_g1~~TRINITY_DN447_c0_g1_i1.p1  ORF type:complete len:220 (-),score=38.80 TRINITY_DN447_c0_g1_i1:21-680(-)